MTKQDIHEQTRTQIDAPEPKIDKSGSLGYTPVGGLDGIGILWLGLPYIFYHKSIKNVYSFEKFIC